MGMVIESRSSLSSEATMDRNGVPGSVYLWKTISSSISALTVFRR